MDIKIQEPYLNWISTGYLINGDLTEQSLTANNQMVQFSLLPEHTAAKLLHYKPEKSLGISLAELKYTIGQLVSSVSNYRVNVLNTISRLKDEQTLYLLLGYLNSKGISISTKLDSVFKDYAFLDCVDLETLMRHDMILPSAQHNYELRREILDTLIVRFKSIYLDISKDEIGKTNFLNKHDLEKFAYRQSEYSQMIQDIGQIIMQVSINSIHGAYDSEIEVKYVQDELSVYNIKDVIYVLNKYLSFLNLITDSVGTLTSQSQFNDMIGYDLLKNIIISYNGIVNLIKLYITNDLEI